MGLETTRDSTVRAYEDNQEVTFWASLAESGLSPAEQRAIRNANPLAGGRALVVGCGTGRESLALSETGFDVVGIDLSLKFVEEASTHSQGRAHNAYAVGDATSLPFRDDKFDLVLIISQMLGHIPNSVLRRKALSEGARVLRPGGVLLVNAYNRSFQDFPITYLLWRLFQRRPEHSGPSLPDSLWPVEEMTATPSSDRRVMRFKRMVRSMWRARLLRARVAARSLKYRLSGRKGRSPRDFYVHPHIYQVSSTPKSGLAFYHIHTRKEFIVDARAAGLRLKAVYSVRQLNSDAAFPSLLRDIDFIHYYVLRRVS